MPYGRPENAARGSEGETIALAYLEEKGYRLVVRNYRTLFGEIDLIVCKDDIMAFTEVKTRSNDSFGQPFEAVTWRKQEKMKKSALLYLKDNPSDYVIRFDIISILQAEGRNNVTHFENAFSL